MALKRMTPASKASHREGRGQKSRPRSRPKPPTRPPRQRCLSRIIIAGLENAARRAEAETLVKIFDKATGWKAQMWGPSIIGYGRYSYTYESGRQGDSCVVGFSPRKARHLALRRIRTRPRPHALLAKLGKTGRKSAAST